MKVTNVSEMQAMDGAAITKFGINEELLMENAGLAVTSVIDSEFGISGKSFLVVCGIGNNGGDGFVIARKIYSLGGSVRVIIIGDPKRYSSVAGLNHAILKKLPIDITTFDSVTEFNRQAEQSDAIVDAIFGTGLVRSVEGQYKQVINQIIASGKPVFSVDIPSGINGNNGQVMGTAVKADWTISLGLPKTGNLLFPGFAHCGNLVVTHISFPPELYDNPQIKVAVNYPPKLPPRDPAGHKSSFGEALFIAGAANYYGAPLFAASSFLKAGGGYSRLVAPESIIPQIAEKNSEIVYHPFPETESGSLRYDNLDDILKLAQRMDMVVVGPGLSLVEETQALVRELIKNIEQPLLVDGDGLTAVANNRNLLQQRKMGTVLTPHLGEMSRLTGLSVEELQREPIPNLQQTCREMNAVIVLKGAHSLIGLPDGRVFINLSGNSGMASAGSGDVLTGTITAMFGLGLQLEPATCMGVYIHGLAGDLAANDLGADGLTANNILDYLPQAVKSERMGLPENLQKKYWIKTVI